MDSHKYQSETFPDAIPSQLAIRIKSLCIAQRSLLASKFGPNYRFNFEEYEWAQLISQMITRDTYTIRLESRVRRLDKPSAMVRRFSSLLAYRFHSYLDSINNNNYQLREMQIRRLINERVMGDLHPTQLLISIF